MIKLKGGKFVMVNILTSIRSGLDGVLVLELGFLLTELLLIFMTAKCRGKKGERTHKFRV